MGIGQRIRDARIRRGYSQQELGKRIGAAQPTIAGWESGKGRNPSRTYIVNLARTLGLTPEFLEFGPDGGAERGRDYDHDVAPGGAAAEPDAVDVDLLIECVKTSMRALVARHGLDFSEEKYREAAETAVTAYYGYFRLRGEDERGVA